MKLYHGSGYKHRILLPGFERSGVERRWDKTESNRYLYATTEPVMAVLLGIASAIEQRYPLDEFHIDGKEVTYRVAGGKKVNLRNLPVWLYTLDGDDQSWTKVNNVSNGMDTEYRTQRRIIPQSVQKIVFPDWLDNQGYVLRALDE